MRRKTISKIQSGFRILLVLVLAVMTCGNAGRLPWTKGSNVASRIGHKFLHHDRFETSTRDCNSFLSGRCITLRGGSTTSTESTSADDNDEERYSRQVYTLGARAHRLVRSSCVIVDGPLESGLVWESLKNLALSGIGKIVIVADGDEEDADNALDKANKAYHIARLDDLGETYIRGARAEITQSTEEIKHDIPLDKLLVEFLFRLNPSLHISTMPKKEFVSGQPPLTSNSGKTVFLCLDRPYDQQERWNELCRSQEGGCISFVSAETAGVYGRVFCDFGPVHEVHDADGEQPLVTPLDRIEKLAANDDNDATTFLVKCMEGERHDVSKNDIIIFQRPDGSLMEDVPLKVTKVLTPQQVYAQIDSQSNALADDVIQQINSQASSFSRQKQIQVVHFMALKDATEQNNSLFTACDLDKSFDQTRRNTIFGSFQALNAFVRQNNRMPLQGEDMAKFLDCASDDLDERHSKNFLKTCRAKFVPLQATFGAIASQECLKAVSGLYNPTHQFLMYDCDEVMMPSTDNNDASALSCILGAEVVNSLHNTKLFVVGSGAIGCEILKNLAAMGAGTAEKGRIIVTDMDTIEKSNLSRQLLFRDCDIGKFKSKAAQEAIARLNPSVKMECHTNKVGDDEDPGAFDAAFWSKGFDIILNALDNMEARLYMDGQCLANEKALIDAGTLGSKGNVQVVVPHQSESYGSSADPPEPAIPVCTLKNFPYAISHTIQWGRDLFEGLFVRRPRQANKYGNFLLKNDLNQFSTKLDQDLGDQAALEAATELSQDILAMFEKDNQDETAIRAHSIGWAAKLARELFHDAIEDLLLEHPVDSVDEDGEPFWSGSRKMPQKLSYDHILCGTSDRQEEINKNLVDFVRSGARLRYEMCTGIPKSSRDNLHIMTNSEIESALSTVSETSKVITLDNNISLQEPMQTKIKRQLQPLELINSSEFQSMPALAVAEFEKDDDSNDHITFITAASNLRAICYGIPPVDAMETRKVAGKIVPAMITTTALVSALSCIELVKLCTAEMTLQRHRNAFINLALPFFAFTAPLPAEEYLGFRGATHTMWDRITIKEGKKAAASGGLTLKKLLKRIRKKTYKDDPDAVSVSNISFGAFMIYASFLHEDDEEMLRRSIWNIIEEAAVKGNEFDQEFSRDCKEGAGENAQSDVSTSLPLFVDLTIAVEDVETGEEVELPPVRLVRTLLEE